MNKLLIVIFSCFCLGFLFGFYQRGEGNSIPNKSSPGPRSFVGNSFKSNKSNQTTFDVRSVGQNLSSLDQTNPSLIRYTRKKHLTPPSKQEYNLKMNDPENMRTPAVNFVLKVLENKSNGRFIEVGANDGETISNTLYLEKYMNWSGVLIECYPELVPVLMSKHRKAWVASVCLSPNKTAGTLNFRIPVGETLVGTLGAKLWPPEPGPIKNFKVPTMPLYTILAALGWHEIDFFSLDVEGIELSILKTIPFDKLKFKVIVVEVTYYQDERGKNDIKAILTANGYVFVGQEEKDFYFVRKSLADKIH